MMYKQLSKRVMTTPIFQWCLPPERLVLGDEEVHVWRAILDLPTSQVQMLERVLAADERIRAEQFHFQKDRIHFIVARGRLRTILGRYLMREPHGLRFHYSHYGKPMLVEEVDSDTMCFNVTHSRGMALYAIGRKREIGIDLEYINTRVEYEQIAERFFSPHEVHMLHSLPQEMRREAFFSCWTRKEAYIKARGLGLSLALDQFDVSLAPGVPAAMLDIREEG